MMRFHDTELSSIVREKLCPSYKTQSFKKNEIIFLKDDPHDEIYFVKAGEAKAITFDPDGKSVFFMDYEANDIFGYYAAFTKKPRTATLVAQSDLDVYMIPAKSFMAFLAEDPKRNELMMTYLASHLRHNSLRLSRNSALSATERVAAFLVFLMEENNTPVLEIDNREDFASQLDLTRETLSRVLNKFIKEKAISLEHSRIEILQPSHLYEIISQEA